MGNMVIIRSSDTKEVRALRYSIVRQFAEEMLAAGSNVMVRLAHHMPKRSLEQNDMMWKLLHALSDNLLVPVMDIMAGKLVQTKLSPEDMKDFMSAQFKVESAIDEQKRPMVAVVGNGVMVMLGLRTSSMNTRQMSEFIEFLIAKCAEENIKVEWDNKKSR